MSSAGRDIWRCYATGFEDGGKVPEPRNVRDRAVEAKKGSEGTLPAYRASRGVMAVPSPGFDPLKLVLEFLPPIIWDLCCFSVTNVKVICYSNFNMWI